jgi:hypothetical protein
MLPVLAHLSICDKLNNVWLLHDDIGGGELQIKLKVIGG